MSNFEKVQKYLNEIEAIVTVESAELSYYSGILTGLYDCDAIGMETFTKYKRMLWDKFLRRGAAYRQVIDK